MRPKGAILFHIRDGKVRKVVQYLNRDNALADLGIPSESISSRS